MTLSQNTRDIIESVLQRVSNSAPIEPAQPEVPIEEPAFRSMEWQPEGGQKTKLKDLADSHLRNIIFYLQRRAGHNSDLTHAKYLTVNTLSDEPIWKAVLAEADYRKLSWS